MAQLKRVTQSQMSLQRVGHDISSSAAAVMKSSCTLKKVTAIPIVLITYTKHQNARRPQLNREGHTRSLSCPLLVRKFSVPWSCEEHYLITVQIE
ncbi:hypothetical protein BDR05DRAFT_956236 [Suillus weaverae]|nr:hypothetical protein BDR05DRAFT_956236 [Suillus weaverae]